MPSVDCFSAEDGGAEKPCPFPPRATFDSLRRPVVAAPGDAGMAIAMRGTAARILLP